MGLVREPSIAGLKFERSLLCTDARNHDVRILSARYPTSRRLFLSMHGSTSLLKGREGNLQTSPKNTPLSQACQIELRVKLSVRWILAKLSLPWALNPSLHENCLKAFHLSSNRPNLPTTYACQIKIRAKLSLPWMPDPSLSWKCTKAFQLSFTRPNFTE